MLTTSCLSLILLACPPHEGKHEQIEAATVAVEKAPQNLGLRLARAEVFLLHGELQSCADDLEIAAGLVGDQPTVVLMRARLQYARKQLEPCLSSLGALKAADLEDETSLQVLSLRADCLTGLKRTVPAIDAWGELIAAHPQPQPDWYLKRASLQASIPMTGIATAISGLDQAISRHGNVVVLLLRAAELEEQLGRFDAAVARFQVLAEQSQRQETWLAEQAMVLLRADRHREARVYLERALHAWQQLPAKRRSTFSMRQLGERIADGLEECSDA